jgi:hypothetical protein
VTVRLFDFNCSHVHSHPSFQDQYDMDGTDKLLANWYPNLPSLIVRWYRHDTHDGHEMALRGVPGPLTINIPNFIVTVVRILFSRCCYCSVLYLGSFE